MQAVTWPCAWLSISQLWAVQPNGHVKANGSHVTWLTCQYSLCRIFSNRTKQNMEVVVMWWCQQHTTEFCVEGVHQLMCQWDSHINAHMGYLKWCLFLQPHQSPSGFLLNKHHNIIHIIILVISSIIKRRVLTLHYMHFKHSWWGVCLTLAIHLNICIRLLTLMSQSIFF